MITPPEQTIAYRTYANRALVQGLRTVFKHHTDPILNELQVNMGYSLKEVDYPSIIVNFMPSRNQAAGVGHREQRWDPDTATWVISNRRLYWGTIEFRVFALSTVDRDLILDSLTQILGMHDFVAWTNRFWLRLYKPEEWAVLENQTLSGLELYHFINVSTDRINESSPTQSPAPWQPEDVLLYEGAISVPVFGEVLSIPPDQNWTTIQNVHIYPYIGSLEPVPTGVNDTSPWIPG